MIRVPKSNLRLVLEEKSEADFFKMALRGETPPGVGEFFKRILYQSSADFDRVREVSHLTTAEGRRYRR